MADQMEIVAVVAQKSTKNTSFVSRQLRVILTMPNAVFTNGENQLIIENMPVRANIELFGAGSMPHAVIEIYGLRKSDMNAMTVYPWGANKITNTTVQLQLMTGETIFSGTFLSAQARYESAPNVSFVIDAYFGLANQLSNDISKSFPGTIKVSAIAKELADSMGMAFIDVNNMPNVITDQHLWGSNLTKLWSLEKYANIKVVIDSVSNTVLIFTNDGYRKSESPPLISAESGLVGWPSKVGPHMWSMKALYSSEFKSRGNIVLNSVSVPGATNKLMYINSMTHMLESNIPNGAWFTDMMALEI